MKLHHSRAIATFVTKATLYGPTKTLADSLEYAWTSVYTQMSDADAALAWLRANVISISNIRLYDTDSPAIEETKDDVPRVYKANR